MQRKWRRAWLRGKPHFMRYQPVRKIRTRSLKAKVYSVTAKVAKKLVPAAAAAGVLLSTLTGVQANPSGGAVTSGTGSITGQGTNSVTINQTSDKLGINWNSFSINSGEKVQFIQPGTSSIALNRVLGNNASAIYGQLSANGQIFLINPNGVLFAKGAQVNVGGLVASTLNISDKDFMNSKYTFSGDSQKSVLNQGTITANNGGYVALLGANVANEGVIVAQQGTVAMGAGSKVTLDFAGDGLLTLSVDESAVNAQAKNSGLMKADGGLVVMNAKAADSLTGSVVNNSGTVEAKSVISKNGTIILAGSIATNSGTLDASGKNPGETGGTIKVLGDTVALASGSKLDVSGDKGGGTAIVGGAYQGGNSEYAATKTTVEQGTSINADALTRGNGGQVVVWANDTTTFAGSISAKGGKVSGDGGSVETSGKKILTVADTASVNTTAAKGKTGNWLLDPADIKIGSWENISVATLQNALNSSNVTITTGSTTGTMTTGSTSDLVTNNADGGGDITVKDSVSWNTTNSLTLSAYRNININAAITNTSTDGANVTLRADNTGTGIGRVIFTDGIGSINTNGQVAIYYNPIIKVSTTIGGNMVSVNSYDNKIDYSSYVKKSDTSTAGNLAAYMLINNAYDLQYINANSTTRSGSYALGKDIDASTTSTWGGAGFMPIGNNYANRFTGTFNGDGHIISGLTINSSATNVGLFGAVAAGSYISNVGLVGGSVTGNSSYLSDPCYVGGLVGLNYGNISNAYNTGSVTNLGNKADGVGGLVGYNVTDGSYIGNISNAYNTGNVSSSNPNATVGGLVGINKGTIKNSYATGSMTGTVASAGGLVGGTTLGTIENSYWDVDTTGQAKGVGNVADAEITGQYTALYSKASSLTADPSRKSAFSASSYSWFDASGNSDTWYMVDGSTRPFLRSEYSTTITNAHQLQLIGMNSTTLGASYTLAKDISMSELTNPSGMWRTSSTAASNGNYGFNPIGNSSNQFKGTFDGGGHTISGLTINSSANHVGLFGYTGSNSQISNVGLVGGSVTSTGDYVGGLVGYNREGKITDSYATGNVTGRSNVGGLAGYNGNTITNSYATDSVTGTGSNIGGLVGYNGNTITNSYATGSVTGSGTVGGLAGNNANTIANSYATGSVTGTGTIVGGLAGYNANTITNSYATGSVNGSYKVGGLVGLNAKTITNSYATGSVTGSGTVGGLAGNNNGDGTVENSYATGSVTGTETNVGGLVGFNDGGIDRSYWDVNTTGKSDGCGTNNNGFSNAVGLHSSIGTAFAQANYSGFDFTNTWGIIEGTSYPYLKWRYQATPQVVSGIVSGATVNGQTVQVAANGTLIGSATTGANGFYYFLFNNQTIADNAALLTYVDNSAGSVQANAVARVNGANASNTGLALTSAAVNVYGNDSSAPLDVNTLMTSAKGSLADSDLLYTANNGNISVTGGLSVLAPSSALAVSNALTASGDVLLKAKGNLTLDAAGSVSSTGGTVTLVSADGQFINNNTATNALSGSRWLVYSATPNIAQRGNLDYSFSQYGKSFDDSTALAAAGNGFIYSGALSLSATLIGTVNKGYDGKIDAVVTTDNVSITGLDDAIYSYTLGEGSQYDNKNAGDNKAVTAGTVTLSGVTDSTNKQVYGYSFTGTNISGTIGNIDQAALTITAATNSKTYDGTTTATVTPTYTGIQEGDTLTGLVEAYTDKNAGSGKTLQVKGYTVSDGNNGGNYTVSLVDNTAGNIDQAALTITAATNSKIYDGTTTATVTPTYAGLQEGDTLTGLIEAYTDKNAGSGKTLQVTGYTVSDGNNGSNYAVSLVDNTAGNIDQAALTITAATNSKTYDGTTTATVTPTYTGLQEGDTMSGLVEAYTDKNAGNGKTLQVTGYTVSDGNNGGNYAVSLVDNTAGNIDQAALTITAATNSKTYDGTTTATVTPTYAGLQEGDTLTGLVEAYTDKNAGSGKTLQVKGYTVSDGNNGGNYTVSLVDNTAGNIDQAALTITAATNSKTYDGTTTATVTPTYTGLQEGDTLTGLIEAYTDKNAGSDKILQVKEGFTVSDGNNGGNYHIMTVDNTAGMISQRQLTATAIAQTKVYDDTTDATIDSVTFGNFVEGEILTASYSDAAFTDKNVGDHKTVTLTGIAMTAGANTVTDNYLLPTDVVSFNASITPAALTITAATNSKTYDGTTTATVTPTYTGLKGDDTLTGLIEAYTDKNAGKDKTLQVTGYTVSDGNNGGNYAVSLVDNTAGNIDQAALTITAATNSKIYDGTTTATVTPTYAGLQEGDTLTGLIEAYTNKNAGKGKTLQVKGYTVSDGNNGGNYTVSLVDNTAGNIDQAALTITAAANSKTYDGTTTATVTPTYTGLQEGDTMSGLVEAYTDKNAGSGKTLQVTGYTVSDGNNGSNYVVSLVDNTAGNIDQAALTITAATNSKIYDGTTTATGTPTYAGLQGDDTLSGLVEAYTDKNAGSGKTLQVKGYTVSDGNNGGNYTVSLVDNTAGNIDQAALTITAATNSKIYDGTTTATATPTYAGLQGDDTLTGLIEAYTDKNAGSGKTLQVTDYTVSDGNNGGNYTVSLVDNTAGNINKAALAVTANDDAKIYDKLTYSGGKGVTYAGFVNGEEKSVLDGSLTYGGTSQGATEVGNYIITPSGLTAMNYTVSFKDGTLTIKPAAMTDPGYIAAVQNTQQTAGNNPQQAGNNSAPYPPATNGLSQQAAGSQVSPVQYRRDNTQTPRVITTSGQTVTVAQDGVVQLNTNTLQHDIHVYQTTNGSTALATAYHVDGSQGALSLTSTVMAAPALPQAPQAAPLSQADTASFQLTDAEGRTADFTIAYIGSNLHVKAVNAMAADMLTQNQQQLITATALVTAQDKLSVDVNELQTVYLEQ